MWLLALLACRPSTVGLGSFEIVLDRDAGRFSVSHLQLPDASLDDVQLLSGSGSAEVEMQFGAFRFSQISRDLMASRGFGKRWGRRGPVAVFDVADAQGERLGTLAFSVVSDQALDIDFSPADPGGRVGFSAACTADDHFLGLGLHAQDVDHVGEAFGLWVSEQGIGKTSGEEPGADWMIVGTKHQAYYPVPFALRPQLGQGLLLDADGRVDVDLCATDPERFELLAWDDAMKLRLLVAPDARGVVQELTARTGRPPLPAPWAFMPWADAIRGSERVRQVAARLRDFEVPSAVIWSEDWKGAEQTPLGYHLTGEWTVDRDLYPDAEALAEDLDAQGFRWLAYFSPFVFPGTQAWDEAVAADVVLKDAQGEPYTWLGATAERASMVDLSTGAGRSWFQQRMQAALDLGFDGWMVDYAEWLPLDVQLASGEDPAALHNHWPELWQRTNAEVLSQADTVFFSRSGWTRSSGLAPVVWAGDQATSFDPGDGFPTVVPLGLGAGAVGIGVFTHDIGGYAPFGPPSDKELWFRWASLAAFSPVMRTHHGAVDDLNWQLDSDADTTRFFATMASEHMLLWPYRYGLAARAHRQGIPMIQPVGFVEPSADWSRTDAWMLGDALLVAPVQQRGVSEREVVLPGAGPWYDWFSTEPVSSGVFEVATDQILVFARGGTTVPTFAQVPQTASPVPGLLSLDDVDGARVVYLFGGGGPFEEADGTRYTPSGTPTEDAVITETLQSGVVSLGGVNVAVRGDKERSYTFVLKR